MQQDSKNAEALRARLLRVEEWLIRGDPESLALAREETGDFKGMAMAFAEKCEPEDGALALSLCTARGHVERASGELRPAAESYRRALAFSERAGGDPERRRLREANLWVCLGLAQLSGEKREDWEASLDSFGRAIKIRREAVTEDFRPEERWGLAAAWLNRADALAKLGGEDRLDLALAALDEADEVLRAFDPDATPAVCTRFAIAAMNRGNCLARLSLDYPRDHRGESLASYGRAVDLLRPGTERGSVESRRMLAVALANLARARLELSAGASREDSTGGTGKPDAGAAELAEKESRETLGLIADEGRDDPALVELELTARLTLCRALERFPVERERHLEISDVVEEGLTDFREGKEGEKVPPLSASTAALLGDLFRCGAEAYLRHQPGFLAGYLLDHLDPEHSSDRSALVRSAECHEAAVEVLWEGIARMQGEAFGDRSGGALQDRTRLLAEWQHCRDRLAQVRERFFELR